MRRLPLWTSLIPLVLGLALYGWYWDRERDAFQASLETVFGDGRAPVGGFPYRLEAEVSAPRFAHDGQYALDVRAERLVANRQPWREGLTFLRLLQPQLRWQAKGVEGAGVTIVSADAQTSLRLTDGRIVRLSSEHGDATVRLPFVPATATAPSFGWHFRETPTSADPASRSPTFPQQAQLVLEATALRFGKGAPLRFAAQIDVTSAAPVWDLAGWRRGGTIELRRLTLSDKAGDVLTITATGSPARAGPVQVVGTIETVCPSSVQALFAATAAPTREYRARRPVKISFGGPATAPALQLPPGGLRRLPIRAQEAPCPVLYR